MECHRVAINVWRGVPKRSDWLAVGQHFDDLHRRFRNGVGALVLFPHDARDLPKTFSLERREMEAVARKFASIGSVCATIIEGSGFVPAAVRSVLSGVIMVARPAFPNKVFEGQDDAIHWLVPHALKDEVRPKFTDELKSYLTFATRTRVPKTVWASPST